MSKTGKDYLAERAEAKLVVQEEGYLRLEERLWTYKPNSIQRLFHQSPKRSRALFGGNRSGKSWAGAVEAVMAATGEVPEYFGRESLRVGNEIHKIPIPNEGWVISLDYPKSRDVAEPLIRRYLPDRYIRKWSQTDRIMELKNGSTIGYKSVDSGFEKFMGVARHWIWFDEEPSWEIWKECIMRLVDYQGYTWITMTPEHGMSSWSYDTIWEMRDEDPDLDVFTVEIYDNKENLPAEEIPRLERLFQGEEGEAKLRGRFVEFAGLVYKEFRRETHTIEPFRIPAHWSRYMCIDPGVNNPTAVMFLAVDPDNNLYIYDEYYESDRDVADNAAAIKKIMGSQKFIRQLIDPAAEQRDIGSLQSIRQQYMKQGIFALPANNDVSAGILAVKEFLKVNPKTGKPRLFFFSHCLAAIKEIERYRWATYRHDADNKNLKERPQKVSDHLMDTLRYVCADSPRYSSLSTTIEASQEGYRYTNKFTRY